MFTGIIEATAKVTVQGGGKLMLERPVSFDDVRLGSSISVSGVCLTVAAMDARALTFDVMPETVAKTTIGDMAMGDVVNLERALSAHGRFEGHVVQGHIEGTGEVIGLQNLGGDVRLTIRVPAELQRAIVPKGSICLDGVSLTIADVGPNSCTVALIPITLQSTTLGVKRMGDRVNIETDILVRTLLVVR
ncbi:MAG: riboflavin synthase [Candidatus Peribacteraceae bacterium]|nr:riboflavin synthase [Candidatus Peribacteraceae bacterium]